MKYLSKPNEFNFVFTEYYGAIQDKVRLEVHGGVPPFEFSLLGPGTLVDSEFHVPEAPGSTTVVAIDQWGRSASTTVHYSGSGADPNFGKGSGSEDFESAPISIASPLLNLDSLFAGSSTPPPPDWVPPTILGFTIVDIGFQSSGKVIALGMAIDSIDVGQAYTYDCYFTLLRFNADGSLDGSFGSGGSQPVGLELRGNYVLQMPAVMEVLPDDKIVVAGTTGIDAQEAFVRRFTKDGAADSSFGGQGYSDPLRLEEWGHDPGTGLILPRKVVNEILVQPDGSIVLVGSAKSLKAATVKGFSIPGLIWSPFLARYTSAGHLDSNFSESGALLFRLSSSNNDEIARTLTLQEQNLLVASSVPGQAYSGYPHNDSYAFLPLHLARFTPAGYLDTNFGPSGTGILAQAPPSGLWYLSCGLASIIWDPVTEKIYGVTSIMGNFSKRWPVGEKISQEDLDSLFNVAIVPFLMEIDKDGTRTQFTTLGFLGPVYTDPDPNDDYVSPYYDNPLDPNDNKPDVNYQFYPNYRYNLPVLNYYSPFNTPTQIRRDSQGRVYVVGGTLNRFGFLMRLKVKPGMTKHDLTTLDSSFEQPPAESIIPGMPKGLHIFGVGPLTTFDENNIPTQDFLNLATSVGIHPNGQIFVGLAATNSSSEHPGPRPGLLKVNP